MGNYSPGMIHPIRTLWKAVAFPPFPLRMADGRVPEIPHPDFFWMTSNGSQIAVENVATDNVHCANPVVIGSVSRISEFAGQPA